MQNTKLKSMALQDRMSTLVLSIEHYDDHSDTTTRVKVSVRLEPQVYSKTKHDPENLEKPRYVSGSFKDGKFTEKTLEQICKNVITTIRKTTGKDVSSECMDQIAEQIRNNWTYSLA